LKLMSVGEDASCKPNDLFACIRRQCGLTAFEEHDIERLFQLTNLGAEARLGDTACARRCVEAAVVGNGHGIFELA